MCKGLEERLNSLSLSDFTPPLELCIKDIDGVDVPSNLKARYSLEVPVLFLQTQSPFQSIELPRVSPRMQEEGLSLWLQKVIKKHLVHS